ncbi:MULTISPECIES: hydrogenase formation protein HypD [Bradyrhizobium]|uniref:Hydrogenase maturation factor n=3 Tax=Bradyrhizobium TaxID=374 RepID=A0AAE6CCN2_9BRAD|nr:MULTISPECIES: hydrogenase formation protein HypD [Bradyrhizobium]MCG2628115.1 hydrogenase formation protein HypD [Bradyrhizobium zhengyangense]MCG2643234.1 hydrogenase formation protein HypD [Bradyrhizobium zhengyangense]MCG2670452.1 hydrogenase formation protein HypD [Bradyrhizobium zhengyangense]MDN4985813.1 hydrogenase formation protein HypD [Bradyrhizobium sp. WYCCWR 13022]MDT4736655.1 hydrogenase formation protein HypD [Bradyrhizobium sp. WYCCWR 12699]
MKYVDEFRDGEKARVLIGEIESLVSGMKLPEGRPLYLMEVCGGHTHSIFRYGLEGMLPKAIELVHGPGCPVCVLPMGRVDDCVAIAENPKVIFTTFGDAMRVPGSRKSLLQAKADGADVRMVYSPMDALQLARRNPAREVVFFGLGFETTMPSTALTILQAESEGIRNFSVFCNHITIVPTIKAILDSPGLQLDGFLGPGHVSMVIGTAPYEFIANFYRKPMVVAGFEPLDILQSIWMLLKQIAEGRVEVENQYARVVPSEGNNAALRAVAQVYELREFFEWRGLGSIDHSGVRLRDAYVHFDAERKFAIPNVRIADPKSCQCGEVLKGALKPWQCKVFGTSCTPETPLGALMVSSEGACAAYYQYGGQKRQAEVV